MRIATDIGGTFTDLVYVDENGNFGTAKSDTTPVHFDKGVINVIKKSGIDTNTIDTFIHGTTIIINALTERKGVKTALITTKGFRDILEIARGNRPDLFNIRYKKPVPFVERYLRQEVNERVNYKGEVITSLDTNELESIINYYKEQNIDAIAIAYLHSYQNPIHEQQTAEYIQSVWPEVAVTCSYEVTKEWREYERTNTTVLNSYVRPIAETYVNRLGTKLDELQLDGKRYIMQSNGGTTSFDQAKQTPINLVESGPVAGIFGASVLGNLLGEENIIAFDIGGTTAKCSLISNGEVKITTDYYIEKNEKNAGYPIKVPVVDIVEIGNGGGSIAHINKSGSLQVGPQSAGSAPGPVAYGRGGENPTTTDANLYTGRLSLANFNTQSSMEAIAQAIDKKIAVPYDLSTEEAAVGIIRLANSNMLNALKLISVRKGHDPRDFSLIAFGGGGSLHAAALAKELGVKKVIVPIASSVFSAFGMLMTDLRYDFIKTLVAKLDTNHLTIMNKQWENIEKDAAKQLKEQGIEASGMFFNRMADLRYAGQEHTVKVNVPSGTWNEGSLEEIVTTFHTEHEKNYTFKLLDKPIEIVNMHVVALGHVEKPALKEIAITGAKIEEAVKEIRMVYFEDEGWLDTDVYDRDLLEPDMTIEGPIIVEEPTAASIIYPNQTLTIDKYGNLHIEI